ncbi:MAG: hypothetical protein AAFQ36_03355 [Pseudomonadota bacterium]
MDRTLSLPIIATLLGGFSLVAVLHFAANASARYEQRQRLIAMDDSRLADMGITRNAL